MLIRVIVCCLALTCVSGALVASEADSSRRVFAHVTIRDYNGALEEVEAALKRYPNSLILAKARIEVLAAMGQETAMLRAWDAFIRSYPESQGDNELLEAMAWGIIRKGAQASSPITIGTALLAAQKAQDARGVALLTAAMRSNNSLIRALSVDLAGKMRDSSLRQEILRMLRQEPVWAVRMGAVRAAGQMKLHEAEGLLEQIIADPSSPAEEKAVAIEALVNLMEKANPAKLRTLVASNRAGLRLLACQVAVLCSDACDIKLLLPLLHDVNGEARAIVLQVIGLLRSQGASPCNLKDIATQKLSDSDPDVAISAAWLLTLEAPDKGQRAFQKWLSHPREDVRLLAVGALVSTGQYGLPLMQAHFCESEDPYVRLNLALGLIGQRVMVQEACAAIAEALTLQERWQWEQTGIFRRVVISQERHRDGIANYPEAVNQMVRLELLNTLAIMKSPQALESVRRFLQERNWGISGLAAALLLSEDTEEAVDVVAALLEDPDRKVRVQAALAMAVLGGDDRALGVLHEAYEGGDRVMKEKVLEALGAIGSLESVPFLINKLSDPHQNLRIFAASALLACLNH